jgi:hypothetical protein
VVDLINKLIKNKLVFKWTKKYPKLLF